MFSRLRKVLLDRANFFITSSPTPTSQPTRSLELMYKTFALARQAKEAHPDVALRMAQIAIGIGSDVDAALKHPLTVKKQAEMYQFVQNIQDEQDSRSISHQDSFEELADEVAPRC